MQQVWLRHKNGGGKKFGNECEVGGDSFLDRASSVGDRAEVFNAIIRNSLLCDDVLVCGYPSPVEITNCELTGNTRLWQCPTLNDVSLENVSVFGNAVLQGPWSLSAFVRIHQGVWTRPPRHRLITGPAINVEISECVDDCFHIGCWALPYEKWTRPGYRQMIGKRSGWTPEMVELCYTLFRSWRMSPAG